MSGKQVYVVLITQGIYSERQTAPYMYCTSESDAKAACSRVKAILELVFKRQGEDESSVNLGSWLFDKRSPAPWPFEYFAEKDTIRVTYVALDRWNADQGELI